MEAVDNQQLKRVVVVGTNCTGKTTLASQLASLLQVEHIELDALHWLPNWEPRPRDEFRRLAQEAVTAETWVVDGNYSAIRDIVWPRATALVWLNYSFPVIAARAMRRTTRRVIGREVLYSENRETFRKAFLSKESILLWVAQTYRRHRREYPLLFQAPQHQHLHLFKIQRPEDSDRFLHQVAASFSVG